MLNALQRHRFHGIFANPVDPIMLGIPDYLEVIKDPMDLGSVSDKLRRGEYKHPREFEFGCRWGKKGFIFWGFLLFLFHPLFYFFFVFSPRDTSACVMTPPLVVLLSTQARVSRAEHVVCVCGRTRTLPAG